MKGWVQFGLLLLAITGDASAGYDEGVSAAQRCDYAAAYREFSEAAKQGDMDAQVSLLFIGDAGSDEEYLKLLRQAVAANNAGAKYWLAFLTEHGMPHPDLNEIRKLVRESAEGGFVPAMAALGQLYGKWLDPSFDPVSAYAWTNLALRRAEENPKALLRGNDDRRSIQAELDGIVHLLSPNEVARAKDLTDELDRRTPRSKLVIPEPCAQAVPPGPAATPAPSAVPQVLRPKNP
jgi:hypothetical protein